MFDGCVRPPSPYGITWSISHWLGRDIAARRPAGQISAADELGQLWPRAHSPAPAGASIGWNSGRTFRPTPPVPQLVPAGMRSSHPARYARLVGRSVDGRLLGHQVQDDGTRRRALPPAGQSDLPHWQPSRSAPAAKAPIASARRCCLVRGSDFANRGSRAHPTAARSACPSVAKTLAQHRGHACRPASAE